MRPLYWTFFLEFSFIQTIDWIFKQHAILLYKKKTWKNHSHKKRRDGLEAWAVYIEIPLISWNLLNGPKHRGSILKNMASSQGDQLHEGAFHAIMGKIEAGLLQIAKKWNWKWIFMYQGYFFRKIPAANASFTPK